MNIFYKRKPIGFWKIYQNRVNYIRFFEKLMGISNQEQWYLIKKSDFFEKHGAGFLDFYNNSPSKAIMDCVTEYEWEIVKFKFLKINSKSFHETKKDKIEIKDFLKYLSVKFNIKTPNDWYKISQNDFLKNRGEFYLKKFKCNYKIIIMNNIKNDWKEWLFNSTLTSKFWDDKENCKKYIYWLEEILNIKSEEDWYNVS